MKHGDRKWAVIAQSLPGRVGKQCRERWTNHLRPDLKVHILFFDRSIFSFDLSDLDAWMEALNSICVQCSVAVAWGSDIPSLSPHMIREGGIFLCL